MSSVTSEADLSTRARIRESALRLFAERGPDGVTIRDIAAAAGVSPALVLHHFGSKEGLRRAVDDYAAAAFDAIVEGLAGQDLGDLVTEGRAGTLADAFAHAFPAQSPLPDYLRRLLLSTDPAGSALFARWYDATRTLLASLAESGAIQPGHDLDVQSAFFLVNDLALIVLRRQIEAAIGVDPLTPTGMRRWAAVATSIYSAGAFRAPEPGRHP